MDSTFRKMLTPREQEVLSLLARGNTAKEIAASLGVSIRTVSAYTQKLTWKLDACNSTHAVALAICKGIVTL